MGTVATRSPAFLLFLFLKMRTSMKTRRFIIWATALVLAAILGSCSLLEMPVTEEAPVQKPNILTLVTTLSPMDGTETRSVMTDNGTTLSTDWEVGDNIWVNYDDTGDNNLVAKGTVTAVDGAGKATISVDLVDPKDASIIVFGFPYDHWTEAKDVRVDQQGTLDDINANHSAISGSGTLTVSGTDVTLPDGVSMNQEMCIWKLAFNVGGTNITNTITSLNISFGPFDDYMISPNAQSVIYVALYPVDDANLTFTAATPTGIYSFSTTGVTLANGMFYRSYVPLTAAAASDTYRVFTSRTAYSDTAIPGGAIDVTSGTTAWTNGTYVVNGNVTINSPVSVTGDVNLILKDGASLTVNNTITGAGNLNIFGQELSSGKLDVVYGDINVSVSNLVIHGGVITVTEGGVMQGLEAMSIDIYHGKVTTAGAVNGFMVMGNMRIFGGDITTTSTGGAALQIYGSGVPGSLTMTGGTFRATGAGSGSFNKGILVEEGNGEGTATVNISGGTLIATGGPSSISDAGAWAVDVQGTLTISGNANVTANGGTDAYDMSGGYGIYVRAGNSAGGNATISGGTVTATSGPGGMAAINTDGDLAISGATTQIDATGGDRGEGILAFDTITINGGTITATAGDNAIGLEGTTIISGGVVEAIGGNAIVSSDGDGMPGFDGILTMTGGKLIATGGAKDGIGDDGLGISAFSTIDLTGVTMYEGDAANPATPAANQSACTKRYVIVR